VCVCVYVCLCVVWCVCVCVCVVRACVVEAAKRPVEYLKLILAPLTV
jgi:hypothetical protein